MKFNLTLIAAADVLPELLFSNKLLSPEFNVNRQMFGGCLVAILNVGSRLKSLCVSGQGPFQMGLDTISNGAFQAKIDSVTKLCRI